MVKTLFMKVAESRSDLGDLNQFIGVGVVLVIVKNVSFSVVRGFEFRR